MQRAVSTYLFVKERLHPGILDGLMRSGVQGIEIFAARQHLDYANRKAAREGNRRLVPRNGMPLNSVHSPLYADYEWGRAGAPPVNVASTDRAARVEAMDEIKRALEIAEQIPFRFLVQHLGTPNESFSEKKFEAAMTSIEHLRAFAKPLGVQILLENIPNELSTPDRLVEVIHSAHFDDVGVCFDFGHAHMMGSVREAFEILRNHILLHPRPRQRQTEGLAPVAGAGNHRLERSHGAAAFGPANAAAAAGTRGRRKSEFAGEAAEKSSISWKQLEIG